MTRTWVNGGPPFLDADNLNALEADVTTALGVPDAALAARVVTGATAAALNATYAPASGSANYAAKASNLSDLASASAARTNLGLGDAATHPASDFTGAAAGTAGKPLSATDATTTNARTPTAHAATHASGGSDPVTPTAIGLGNVNNTSDASKPVSTAQSAAITAATAPAGTRNPITGVFNVKAYGAVGDGVTNDTGNIQSARTAAGVGGTLYFPPGTYIVDGLTANVNGQTWNLHPEAVLMEKASASSLSALKVVGVNGFTLIGGTIDGNKTNNTGGNMFQISGCTNVILDSVKIQNGINWGMALSGSTLVAIRRCTFLNHTNGVGQATYSGTYGICSDVEFTNNLIDMRSVPLGSLNTGGFTAYGDTTNNHMRFNISNNRIFVNKDTVSSNTGCIGVVNTQYATVNNNICDGSGVAISISGSKFASVNNNVMRNFYDYGLEFAGTSDCSGSGNEIDATGAASFALSLSASAARTSITGGVLLSTTTGKMCVNMAACTDTTFTGVTMHRTASGGACVIANGSGQATFTGNTFIGDSVESAGIKLIGSTGDVAVTGNRFKNFTIAGVQIDAATSITADYVAVTGNVVKGTPAVYAVTGSAVLGTHVQTAPNAF